MTIARFSLLLVLGLPLAAATSGSEPLHLLHTPAMNQNEIVFNYAGNLWTVPRSGGRASELTTGVGVESEPVFSPDGATIAFTGEYDGNIDVYTIPAAGGIPKRLTYAPGMDRTVGWTPDGKNVIFRSGRESVSARYTKLFTVSIDGGLPVAMPFPMGFAGVFSPDGKRFAYAPIGDYAGFHNYVAWKRYRGGMASFLWIADMSDLGTEKIPHTALADFNPMWIGNKIYFLSDREGPATLYSYDLGDKAVKKVIDNSGFDIRWASAGPGGIIYEQFGSIYIYALPKGRVHKVDITVTGDMPEVRPHFEDVSRQLSNPGISPTGVRAVFEAHGEILTVPAEHGDPRDLTNTPGVMEREPVWSPDGQHIAYFSDESGEYALHISSQMGGSNVKKIPLNGGSSYYFEPKWSPDSKLIAFRDNKLNLFYVDVDSGKITKVGTDYFYELGGDAAWSPDSKWIAYSENLPNRLHAVFLYSIDSGKSTQVTDGMSDARFPSFDRDGKYLYFTASTNYGTESSGLDMTSDAFQVTRSVYAIVLANNVPSPVAPESDDEKAGGAMAAGGEHHGGRRAENAGDGQEGGPEGAEPQRAHMLPPKPVRVDLQGIEMRTVALPIPAGPIAGLTAGREGTIYILESSGGRGFFGGGMTLSKFDLKRRKMEKLADRVRAFDLSANGEKMLLEFGGGGRGGPGGPGGPRPIPQFAIVSAMAPVKPGQGMLHVAGLQVKVDPTAEWKQMYHEVWRIERSYFYDPHYHGVNTDAEEQEFLPYVDSLTSRTDLNYIFQEMLGEFTVGHLRGGGGTSPEPKTVPGGLLGADYEIANGLYRIRHVYTGQSWAPNLHAPLAQPGMNIHDGDYILAVNGTPLHGSDNINRLLEGTANKEVTLRIATDAAGANARDVTVEPIENEIPLRNLAWIEANMRKVDKMSGGKLAYVYMPDTGMGGLTSFNRYFFAQVNKQGLVLDERFNSGGQAADYVIEVLRRPLLGWWKPRYGAIYRTSAGAILGPKVMIINQFAGSGGDAMPWFFRYTKIGTLVGMRTWGGLVGISGYPPLMDGGTVTSPSFGFFSPTGEWSVENHGVPPDVEVTMDPKLVAEGHDPQLERAVSIALEQLKAHPVPTPHPPPFPNYHMTKSAPGASGAVGGN
jgi:tricorn protease